MPATTITKAVRSAHKAYAAAGGTASVKQYAALAAGRAKRDANRAAAEATPVAAPKRRTRKAASQPVLPSSVSELLTAPNGTRCDLMGGNLVVDEAGADVLFAALVKAGHKPVTVGVQTSKRRGIRMQIQVKDLNKGLAVADKAGFRTWSAA